MNALEIDIKCSFLDTEIYEKTQNIEGSKHNLSLNNTKVLTQIGGTTVLPCKVEISSEATITWIRKRDYSILTGS